MFCFDSVVLFFMVISTIVSKILSVDEVCSAQIVNKTISNALKVLLKAEK
jgi:hypothetical protein